MATAKMRMRQSRWRNHWYPLDHMVTHTLDWDALSLSTVDLFLEMGYGNREPEEPVRDLVDAMLREVAKWVCPSCSFSLFDGRVGEEEVHLDNGVDFQVGPVISSLLAGATRFALFAATVGEAFSSYQEELKREDDLLKSFIADVLGTCIVERVGDCMERLLEKELKGEPHTHRLSPGYCGWHLTGQQTLFQQMGGTPCGITLSDVCLMAPIKSISGIIGIGADVNEKRYGCQYCELESCYKRKIRTK